MAKAKSRAWKMERASVTSKGKDRPRSNKYSKGDTDAKPEPGSRDQIWVGGYSKSDGTKVAGYYRSTGG
jgi:hypothetical protein